MKINRITSDSSEYPQRLSSIALMPKVVYSTGQLPSDRRPAVAIVGSRTPPHYGREVTEHFARQLAKEGVVIVSGLALGIDRIAHTATLAVGGTTIAVLAGGLPTIYPASHHTLAMEIVAAGGALITEYPTGTTPLAYRFLARNRIISGLVDAVLIPEATERSGSLSTANHATQQQRMIFAIPGNITSSTSAGTNQLIQSGQALPALEPQTILGALSIPGTTTTAVQRELSPPAGPGRQLLSLLTDGSQTIEELAIQSQLPTSQLLAQLSMLELSGHIYCPAEGVWAKRRD